MKRYTVQGTTTAGGTLALNVRPEKGGRIHAVRVRHPAAAPIAPQAGTADITFTASPIGYAFLTLTNNAVTAIHYPRGMICDITGNPATTILGATVGAQWTSCPIGAYGRGAKDEIVIGVTAGGSALGVIFDIYINER